MTLDELKKLVEQGESETLEFKASTGQLYPAAKTLCAFLNTKGGTVLFGVDNNKKIIGQEVAGKTKEQLAAVFNKFSPNVNLEVEYIDLKKNNHQIIAIHAKSNLEKTPYTYDGKAYWRNQNTTVDMNYEQYNSLVKQQLRVDRTWDSDYAEDYTIDDLDGSEIRKCVNDGIRAGRLPESLAEEPIINILSGFELFANGKVKNSAVVLFAKKMNSSFLHCGIKLALFRGKDKLSGFIDERQYQGNIFTLLLEAEDFIRRNMKIGIKYDPNSFQRIDQPEFPMLALREILVNACCHRNYLVRGACIMVAIFNNRIEIWSPGTLLSDLTMNELVNRNHKSVTRNPTIAKVLYSRKLIEGWGTGISRILDFCKEASNPKPTFIENSGGISVEIKGVKAIERDQRVNYEQKIEKNNSQAIIEILSKWPSGLSRKEIYSLLRSNFNSERTLKRVLAYLVETNVIIIIGRGKAIKYRLPE